MSSVALIGTVVSVGAGAVQANQSRQAAKGAQAANQAIVNNLQYQPIDIAKLTADAHTQAVQNATQSLALENQLAPGVAETRQGLQNSVAQQLAMGGNLPPDVVNQVTNAARVGSGASGTLGGSSIPLTAQMLGVSALGLLNQRQQNASNLLAANPLPTAGLDPGTLATLTANQNAAQNQFNLAKAGVATNLANTNGQLAGAQAGANNSLIGLAGNLLTQKNGSNPSLLSSGISGLTGLFGGASNPATNPIPANFNGSAIDTVGFHS